MKKIIPAFFAAAILLITTGSFAQVNKQDSLALVDLYNSTGGASWTTSTNWLTTSPVSTWNGITVTNNRVTEIDLTSNNLAGPIPASIGNISNLVTLYLYSNSLTGSLPSTLGQLDSIQSIGLDNNLLTGAIPSTIGQLTNLKYLELYRNLLSGSIPSTFGQLSNILYLYLDHNNLTGSIPSSLGQATTLQRLELYDNYLTDSIPSSLGQLSNLTTLYLDYNNLSGTIPASLEQLTSLTALGIYDNDFTFAGMEALATAFSFAGYSPQANIPLHFNGSKLSVSAGGTLSNNTYNWYKGDTLLATNVGDSVLAVTQTGNYSVQVTNSIATALTLYSDTLLVTAFPVKLLNFTATKQGAQTLLQWTTTQEVNSSYYEVQRSSDGINFITIGKVNAAGSSNAAKTYTCTDTKPMSGTNYYRLKAVDKDGQFSYSQVRSINVAVSFSANIYPNPVQSSLNLNFSSDKAMAVQVKIINIEGKTITSRQLTVATGSSTQTINTASLASGIYFARIISPEGSVELKFVK